PEGEREVFERDCREELPGVFLVFLVTQDLSPISKNRTPNGRRRRSQSSRGAPRVLHLLSDSGRNGPDHPNLEGRRSFSFFLRFPVFVEFLQYLSMSGGPGRELI